MLTAILLDLDDTLLANDMAHFLPRYFGLLTTQAAEEGLTIDLVGELIHCTNAVIGNVDPRQSNREVFWELFARRTGLPRERVASFFDRFYTETFPRLEAVTTPDPAAPRLVRWCRQQGWRVVVATNPLFPTAAVEQRLAWAGLPVDRFAFDLVTTFDNMHAAKPQPAYYHEILRRIDASPTESLMVGDDWENDIVPAAGIGCATYWIARHREAPPQPLTDGHGTLAQLLDRLQAGWLQPAANPSGR